VRRLDHRRDDFVASIGACVLRGRSVAATRHKKGYDTMASILENLTLARNGLAHTVQDHIVELGLSTNELLVMWAAVRDERATAATIRRRLGMRQSTFTSLVARLVARGYLRTRRAYRDRRTRYLVPTIPGNRAVRIAHSIQVEFEDLSSPFGAPDVHDRLARVAFLASHLPEPELLDDGLPAVTA
jgi:DNA-binding MarR family transcriptional regulator